MTKEQLLQAGLIIDSEDVYLLDNYTWGISITGYIVRNSLQEGRQKTVSLARTILSALSHEIVDHKNRNTLDNRRANLRLVTRRVNALNSDKTSGVRRTTSGKFQARIGHKNLGSFFSYQEAVAARKKAVEDEIQ